MVASQNIYVLWEFDFEGEEEANRFNPLPSAINIVAQEEIGRLGRQSTVLKQAQQIVVLAMNIPTNSDGRADLDEHGLFNEDVLDEADHAKNLLFLQFDEFARFLRAHIQQAVNDRIDVDVYLFCHRFNY